jgi:outer membrane protein TolC
VYYGDRRTSDFGEFTAGATIPLLRDGPIDRRRAAVRRAELGIEIARLSAAQQRIELTRAAEHRYWDWVAAGKRMQIARDLLGIAVVRDVGLAVRVDRGDIPAFERIENNRAVQQRQAAVVATERALTQASIELSLFLRDADGKPVVPSPMRLPDGFPEPQAIDASSGARDVQLALKRRPEAKRLELVASQQRIERDLADNQRLVGIDLTGQVSQDIGPLPPNHSTVTNVVDPEGLASKLNKTAVSVGVLLDIPILNRVAGGRRDASEASAQRATEQASFAKDRIAADVTDTRNAIELSRERVLATRREVSAAKQLEEMERKRFELGDSTLLIVNLREVAWAESRIREVDGLADYHKAVASYRAATARSLPDR